MELEKNKYYNTKIIDVGINGEGIAKINNFTIFINNTLLNEEVIIKIIKLKKNYGYGKLVEILKPSPYRVTPKCKYFLKCGGCNLLHLEYSEQLKLKSNYIKNNFKKISNIKNIDIPLTLGMKNNFNYRNKAQFPVKGNYNNLSIGFYSSRSHNIVNIDNCIIQDKTNKEILKKLINFIKENKIEIYNEEKNDGLIRHIVTRVSKNLNEIIVCLVVNTNNFKYESELINSLKDIKNIKGIILNFNTKKTNVILSKNYKTIWGKDYIIDYLNNLKFKISILSFYQINPIQTEVLYDKILEFANLNGSEIVVDAYCGIGTISLFLAKNCKKVYGIEVIEDSIKDANFNAKENNIKNVEFICGKSEEIIPNLITNKNLSVDLIVLDPPRKGCEEILLKSIVDSNIKNIVYVSCNPATLARDLKFICENGYFIKKIQPVDMFCHTTHVESVVLISKDIN